jgi:hypothetical protein
MSRTADVRSTVRSLVIFVGVVCLLGLVVIGVSAASSQPGSTLKAVISCIVGLLCLLVVPWSIHTGRTGARMLHFERVTSPLGFWLVVAFWAVIGVVVLGFAGKELQASFTGHAPNNSFKPNPLRGSA